MLNKFLQIFRVIVNLKIDFFLFTFKYVHFCDRLAITRFFPILKMFQLYIELFNGI